MVGEAESASVAEGIEAVVVAVISHSDTPGRVAMPTTRPPARPEVAGGVVLNAPTNTNDAPTLARADTAQTAVEPSGSPSAIERAPPTKKSVFTRVVMVGVSLPGMWSKLFPQAAKALDVLQTTGAVVRAVESHPVAQGAAKAARTYQATADEIDAAADLAELLGGLASGRDD